MHYAGDCICSSYSLCMLVEEVDNLGRKGRWKTVDQSFFWSPVSVVFNFGQPGFQAVLEIMLW